VVALGCADDGVQADDVGIDGAEGAAFARRDVLEGCSVEHVVGAGKHAQSFPFINDVGLKGAIALVAEVVLLGVEQ
jgi:hypothetical protein